MKKGLGLYMLVGLKAIVVSIVATLILILPLWLINWLFGVVGLLVVGVMLGIVWLLSYFIIWGWIANNFWGWK